MRKSKRVREEVFKIRPKIGIGKRIILALPILLSLSWIFYIKYMQANYINLGDGAELFAPSSSQPLIIALVLFTAGYIIFLFLMFSENIREFFAAKH